MLPTPCTSIWPLASQYLWLSDVEDKAVHLNKHCWSISSDHKVCSKDGDVLEMFCKANCVQKVDESVQWPHSWPFGCVCNWVFSWFFLNVLIASLWAFIIVWYDLSLSLLSVIKVALSAKAAAVLLYAVSQWPGIQCEIVILFFVINICFNFWHFWTSVVLGDWKLLIACTADFESEGCMGEFITLALAYSYHIT
jgi:hypothetical protein